MTDRYAKLVEGVVEFAPKNKGSIINYDLDVDLMIADGYKIFVEAEAPSPTEIRMYHYEYTEGVDNITEIVVYDETQEEAEARIARVERERKDALTLTPADVERALYKVKGWDFEDLKAFIHEQLPYVDIKAIAIEFRAKDFYRGAEAGGMRLFDVVGALLGYTTEDMDYLFMNKELPNKYEDEEDDEPLEPAGDDVPTEPPEDEEEPIEPSEEEPGE